jgi:asparagine synthase (glutamine-hydrolysing)
MCGIAGVIEFGGASLDALAGAARGMSAALRHRGPDGAGIWVDPGAGIALAHRRLAVVELSPLGAQPMQSACGRYVIAFNGEIYNFRQLRRELENAGHTFGGLSDTEVLLAAISEWGLQQALVRSVGMFGLAVWDRREKVLSLARDRAGEKPLYYGHLGRTFVFGSELVALEAYRSDLGEIDRDALALYLRHGYIPAPHSIYSRVRKLRPGRILTVSVAGFIAEQPYWSWEEAAPRGSSAALAGSAAEAADQLDSLLRESVRLQSAADVPVGAFLSGGIDSSTLVAMMSNQGRKVRTFTIGFPETALNEAVHARAVAGYLGTEHTELQVTTADAMAVIPKLPSIYSEPFADSSQIPTYLVSQLARRHVTVSLSGDGADELFGGYDRYVWADTLWRGVGWLPQKARGALARSLAFLPAPTVDRIASALHARLVRPGDRLHKIAALVSAADAGALYFRLISNWPDPSAVVRDSVEPSTILSRRFNGPRQFTRHMMLVDGLTYLPDDLLVKIDRASMANSLESRAPFLDHRIIEFASRLPLALNFPKRHGKWLLRRVLHRYVPRQLVDRPKAGFAVPVDQWLRGPLRAWAEDLITEKRLRSEGFFHPAPIRRKWCEHLSGTRNWTAQLWTVLAFQAWNEQRRPSFNAELDCEVRTAGAI